MTRERAKELLPIIQAIADGKDFTLQTPNGNGGWVDVVTDIIDSDLLYYTYRIKPEENHTIEQNAGENRIESGVVSISDTEKVYTCNDCLRYQFCYLAKERKDKACSKISLYEETEKQYRPFKDCNELIEHYQKKYKSAIGCDIYFPTLYKPIIWLKKKDNTISMITDYKYDILDDELLCSWVTLDGDNYNMQMLLEEYTFLDGTPCGECE